MEVVYFIKKEHQKKMSLVYLILQKIGYEKSLPASLS